MHRYLLTLLIASAALANAADPQLVLDLTVAEGGGEKPMIVVWVEKTDGTFVRTLHVFTKAKKYYKDLQTWTKARATNTETLDAVVGATITWGGHEVVKVPAKDLLAGDMVLRVEQRKDKGDHYKKTKIPITAKWPGVKFAKEGYLSSLVITVEK